MRHRMGHRARHLVAAFESYVSASSESNGIRLDRHCLQAAECRCEPATSPRPRTVLALPHSLTSALSQPITGECAPSGRTPSGQAPSCRASIEPPHVGRPCGLRAASGRLLSGRALWPPIYTLPHSPSMPNCLLTSSLLLSLLSLLLSVSLLSSLPPSRSTGPPRRARPPE